MKFYTLILDRSGSMSSIWNEITTAVNTHLTPKRESQLTSLLLFDDRGLDFLYKYSESPTLLDTNNFKPRGNTPLRDAIILGIETLVKDWGEFLWQEDIEVEFVIFSDGQENSSHFWKSEDVSRAIAHFQDSYNWKFSFIGQGSQSDVEKYAKQFSIKTENIISYSDKSELINAFSKI